MEIVVYQKDTKGWRFLVCFRDGSEFWIPFKLIKKEKPIEVAEFMKSTGAENMPAFNW